jgi:hypothetical protein
MVCVQIALSRQIVLGGISQVQVKDYPDQSEELAIGWRLSISDSPGTFGETSFASLKRFFYRGRVLFGVEPSLETLVFDKNQLTRSSVESPNLGFTPRFSTFICRKLLEICGWYIVLFSVGRHNESMRSAS